MMRSMFSVVSGLKAHQTRMDVIGNNIANVNTIGYKAGRVTFKEVFNQTLKGSSAPDGNSGRGGTNPMQIGLGIEIASVDTIMSRGTVQRTDTITDLSIEGEGFFIVKGSDEDPLKFTRAGNFSVDKLGNLVTGSGMNVCGWHEYTVDEEVDSYKFNTINQLETLNIYSDEVNKNKRLIRAKETTRAEFAGNLSADSSPVPEAERTTANANYVAPVTIYSPLGKEYKINISFWRSESENYSETVDGETVEKVATNWHWKVTGDTSNVDDVQIIEGAEGDLMFDDEGEILAADPVGGIAEYTVKPTITIDPSTESGAKSFDINLDFNKLSMFATDSSVKTVSRDGYPAGTMTSFTIGQDGIITGVYSNGQQQPLGMIGLASFDNPAGLSKSGSNLFVPTANSGEFKKATKPGTEDVGLLNPGTLEMSNVDMSKEFIDMIVTQRGFQANSRIITTSDEMLQEMVNMKR